MTPKLTNNVIAKKKLPTSTWLIMIMKLIRKSLK